MSEEASNGVGTASTFGGLLRAHIASLEALAVELDIGVSDIAVVVTKLVELHLLRADLGTDDQLLPTVPGLVTSTLINALERSTYRSQDCADRLRERAERSPQPEHAGQGTLGAIDGVGGMAEIRGLFKLSSQACRDELVVLRPNHHDDEFLDELLEPCYDALDWGVAVRLVCTHHSRAGFVAQAKARRLVQGGVQIRTRSQLPRAAVVVFDDSLAVLLDLPAVDEQPSARRIRDRDTVRFILDMFNQHWDDATPFSAAAPGYAEAADDLHRSIAVLMARGLTDDAVARHLGMSVRTCRRHIAALLSNLNAVSRFQAGVHAVALLRQ